MTQRMPYRSCSSVYSLIVLTACSVLLQRAGVLSAASGPKAAAWQAPGKHGGQVSDSLIRPEEPYAISSDPKLTSSSERAQIAHNKVAQVARDRTPHILSKRQAPRFVGKRDDEAGVGYEFVSKRQIVPRYIGRRSNIDMISFPDDAFDNKRSDGPYISAQDFIQTYRKSDPYFMGKRASESYLEDGDEDGEDETNNLYQKGSYGDELSLLSGTEHYETGISRYVSKRGAPRFVGKRGIPRFVGKRDIPDLVGKRGPPRFVGKRGPPRFVGKRGPPRFVGKRGPPRFVGKRGTYSLSVGPRYASKRGAPRFVGKRGIPRFVGKREVPSFVGKRGPPRFVGKRGPPRFVGKRGPPRFVGKRGPPRFVGKRGPPRFVGKRRGPPRFVGKRDAPRYLVKSNTDDLFQDNDMEAQNNGEFPNHQTIERYWFAGDDSSSVNGMNDNGRAILGEIEDEHDSDP